MGSKPSKPSKPSAPPTTTTSSIPLSSRWILVDDTDPQIQYLGSWFRLSNETQDNLGDYGKPFNNTLYQASDSSAQLSLPFNGSAVTIWGATGVPSENPSLQCFVDGVKLQSNPGNAAPGNNCVLCQSDILSDGLHVVSVLSDPANPGQSILFDQIQYIPSADAPAHPTVLLLNTDDSAVQFDSDWQTIHDGVDHMATQQTGAQVNINFTGSSLTWYALILADSPVTPASATYTFDGGAPVPFTVSGPSASSKTDLFNQIIFTASTPVSGPHSLSVVHGGDEQKAPLTLSYVVVENIPKNDPQSAVPSVPAKSGATLSASTPSSSLASTSAAGSTTTTLSTTSASTSTHSTPTSSEIHASTTHSTEEASTGGNSVKARKGAIIGGTIASFAVVVGAVCVFYFWRMNKKKKSRKIFPFPSDGPHPESVVALTTFTESKGSDTVPRGVSSYTGTWTRARRNSIHKDRSMTSASFLAI